jgi:hypothetical protein
MTGRCGAIASATLHPGLGNMQRRTAAADGIHTNDVLSTEVGDRTHNESLAAASEAQLARHIAGNPVSGQFNREYGCYFGQPPIRDIKALREGKLAEMNAA